MCRSIKKLRLPEQPATETEIRAAALQFIRKVSGFNAPSHANRAAFERAVEEVASATHTLLAELPPARSLARPVSATREQPSDERIRVRQSR